jgi:hypothetical protein
MFQMEVVRPLWRGLRCCKRCHTLLKAPTPLHTNVCVCARAPLPTPPRCRRAARRWAWKWSCCAAPSSRCAHGTPRSARPPAGAVGAALARVWPRLQGACCAVPANRCSSLVSLASLTPTHPHTHHTHHTNTHTHTTHTHTQTRRHRERCGGQGYLSVNRFGELIGFAHAGMTAEGDNRCARLPRRRSPPRSAAKPGRPACRLLRRPGHGTLSTQHSTPLRVRDRLAPMPGCSCRRWPRSCWACWAGPPSRRAWRQQRRRRARSQVRRVARLRPPPCLFPRAGVVRCGLADAPTSTLHVCGSASQPATWQPCTRAPPAARQQAAAASQARRPRRQRRPRAAAAASWTCKSCARSCRCD